MNNKHRLAVVIGLMLLLLTATGVWASATGSVNLPWNSAMGGGAGGDTSESASYSLESSFGGLVQVEASSATYESCSGFICESGILEVYIIALPIVFRD